MNNVKLFSASAFYLIILSIGSITIVGTSWSSLQVLIGVSLVSFVLFLGWNITSAYKLLHLIARNLKLSFIMAICLALMFIPIFVCQKNGISPVFYCLVFSSVFPLISYFMTQKYLKVFVLGLFILAIFMFSKFGWYRLFTLVGPIAAYFLLFASKKLSNKESLNTKKLMFIRYFLLFIFCLFLIPFAHLGTIQFTSIEVVKVLVIALFLNAIPIYCSQYITVIKDHNYFSRMVSLLPLTIFLIELVFYYHSVISLKLFIFSILLVGMMFVFVRKGVSK